jgi:hypothetical protein
VRLKGKWLKPIEMRTKKMDQQLDFIVLNPLMKQQPKKDRLK